MSKMNSEDLRWSLGYSSMEKEEYGIWSPKRDAKKFYIVDGDNWSAIGPFDRLSVPRIYLKANSWMQDGCVRGPCEFGYRVLYRPKRLSFPREQMNLIDVSTLFPALALYHWNGAYREIPISWSMAKPKTSEFERLQEMFAAHGLAWKIENIRFGKLLEPRNFHRENSTVITENIKDGEPFCVVDEAP